MKKFLLPVALCSLLMLGGCLPAIFGLGAASTAVVLNQDRTVAETKDDLGIWLRVQGQLKNCSFEELENICIKVVDKTVFLVGRTPSEKARSEIERLSSIQPGVRNVVNNIKIEDVPTKKKHSRERREAARITAKIKVCLAGEYAVKSNNYKVCTLDKVVYVMGFTNSPEEKEKVLELAARVKGVKSVVDYVEVR